LDYGEDGTDELHGKSGDDYLDGGAGTDTLWGQDGYDRLYDVQADAAVWPFSNRLDGGVGGVDRCSPPLRNSLKNLLAEREETLQAVFLAFRNVRTGARIRSPGPDYP
jgi:Ca2+-binding RTX toxin-like protein